MATITHQIRDPYVPNEQPATPAPEPVPDSAAPPGVVTSLIDKYEALHPLSPNNRLPVPRAKHDTPGFDQSKNKGSLLVSAGMLAGLGLNALQAARVVAKVPQMHRMGMLSRLPDLLLTGPDKSILDPRIPQGTIAANGMSYTKFDDAALRGVAWFGPVMGAYQLGTGLWSVAGTLRSGTGADLVHTREGRSGVLQSAGGAMGVYVSWLALHQIRGATMPVGGGGARALTFAEKVVAMGKAPASLSPTLNRLSIASGAVVALNQFGFFDMLNRNDPRGTGTKLHDAIHETPVVNDPTWRPVVSAAAAGILGWKAMAHVRKALPAAHEGARGLAALMPAARGVPMGLRIGLAGTALVAGASVLGGLGWLDKPPDPAPAPAS